jgi:hypothetical protein
LILGGPKKPDTRYITAAKEQAALKKHKNKRKSYTDKQPVMMVNLLKSADFTSLPQKRQGGVFWGGQNAMIQKMAAVKPSCLAINHSFQLKETLQI